MSLLNELKRKRSEVAAKRVEALNEIERQRQIVGESNMAFGDLDKAIAALEPTAPASQVSGEGDRRRHDADCATQQSRREDCTCGLAEERAQAERILSEPKTEGEEINGSSFAVADEPSRDILRVADTQSLESIGEQSEPYGKDHEADVDAEEKANA